jgi:hypothetical protein
LRRRLLLLPPLQLLLLLGGQRGLRKPHLGLAFCGTGRARQPEHRKYRTGKKNLADLAHNVSSNWHDDRSWME